MTYLLRIDDRLLAIVTVYCTQNIDIKALYKDWLKSQIGEEPFYRGKLPAKEQDQLAYIQAHQVYLDALDNVDDEGFLKYLEAEGFKILPYTKVDL